MLDGEGPTVPEGTPQEDPQPAATTTAAPSDTPTTGETVEPAGQVLPEVPPVPRARRTPPPARMSEAEFPVVDDAPARHDEEVISLPKSAFHARLEQARTAEAKKYADYEALKTQAAELQALKDAQKTEAERQAEELARTRERAQTLEREAREARARALIVSRAAGLGFADPEGDVYPQVLAALPPNEAEELSAEAVDQALADLATRKPYLRGAVAPPLSVVNGSRQTSVPHRSDEQRRQEYFGGRTDQFWGA